MYTLDKPKHIYVYDCSELQRTKTNVMKQMKHIL